MAHRMEATTLLSAVVTQDNSSLQRQSSLLKPQMGCLGLSSLLEQLESSLSLNRRYWRLDSKNQHRRGEQQHEQIHMTNQLVTYN
jgi:hypothetical protein